MKEKKKGYLRDLLLLAGLAAAGGLIMIAALIHGSGSASVRVRVDGNDHGTYPLSENRTVEISGVGGSNLLLIENGRVCMTDADCPDKLCVRQGWISMNGQSIICLPHKTVVEIVSEDPPQNSADGIDIIVK